MVRHQTRDPSFQQNGFMVAFEDDGPPVGGVTTDRISLIDVELATVPTQADCAAGAAGFFGLFRPMLSGNVTIYDAP